MTDLAPYISPSDEWDRQKELAKIVAGTEFVPKGLRGKPEAVLACILTGRELGIGPMQALRHIHIIDGRPSLSAELMAARAREAGHKLRILARAPDEAEVEGVRADDPQHPVRVAWTLAMAERAGLCKLVDGKPVARDQNNRAMPWERYPDAMLLARAVSALCRALFPDVLGGVSYTPEELDADPGLETTVTVGGLEVDRATGEVVDGPPGGGASPDPPPGVFQEAAQESGAATGEGEAQAAAPDHPSPHQPDDAGSSRAGGTAPTPTRATTVQKLATDNGIPAPVAFGRLKAANWPVRSTNSVIQPEDQGRALDIITNPLIPAGGEAT